MEVKARICNITYGISDRISEALHILSYSHSAISLKNYSPELSKIQYIAFPKNIITQLKELAPFQPVGAANLWSKNTPSQIYYDENQNLAILALQLAHEWKHISDLNNRSEKSKLKINELLALEISAFKFQRQVFQDLISLSFFKNFQKIIQCFETPEIIDASISETQIFSIYKEQFMKGNHSLNEYV